MQLTLGQIYADKYRIVRLLDGLIESDLPNENIVSVAKMMAAVDH